MLCSHLPPHEARDAVVHGKVQVALENDIAVAIQCNIGSNLCKCMDRMCCSSSQTNLLDDTRAPTLTRHAAAVTDDVARPPGSIGCGQAT